MLTDAQRRVLWGLTRGPQGEWVDRRAFARRWGVSEPTMSRAITVLRQRGLVEVGERRRSPVGRPAMVIRLRPNRALVGGVVYDDGDVFMALGTADGHPVRQSRGHWPASSPAELATLPQRASSWWMKQGVSPGRIVDIVLSLTREPDGEVRGAYTKLEELDALLRDAGLPVRVEPVEISLARASGFLDEGSLSSLGLMVWIGESISIGFISGDGSEGPINVDPEIDLLRPGGLASLRRALKQDGHEAGPDPYGWTAAAWTSCACEDWAEALGGWIVRASMLGARPMLPGHLTLAGPVPIHALDDLRRVVIDRMERHFPNCLPPRIVGLDSPRDGAGLVAAKAGWQAIRQAATAPPAA